MSGGDLDYAYSKVNYIVDDLEALLNNDFKDSESHYDQMSGYGKKERKIVTRNIKKLIKSLKENSNHLKELEWFLSGDSSFDHYLRSRCK